MALAFQADIAYESQHRLCHIQTIEYVRYLSLYYRKIIVLRFFRDRPSRTFPPVPKNRIGYNGSMQKYKNAD